jgi:hypothetical protein
MPGGDRTGPVGMGPMTGRAAGYCAGYPAPGYMNPGFGRGGGAWGWGGRGRGRGWRHWYHATGVPGWARAAYGWPGPVMAPSVAPAVPWGAAQPSKEQEVEFLKNQANYFNEALGEIQKRLEELEASEE